MTWTNDVKISIITAVYNGARDIGNTLKSVAEQDHEAIEHIIIDGASTDSTVDTIRLCDQRVSRLLSEPDAGVYDAFNKGLRLATGDAIGFLNSGDTYTSSCAVSKIAENLQYPGVDAVFGDVLIVDAFDHAKVVRRYSSRAFAPARMAYGFMPAHPTLFMRRQIYDRVGEFDTRFRIAGDFELCLRVFVQQSTTYCYLPEALVRMPRGGLSNKGWRSTWEITREMRLACSQDHVKTNWAKLCLRLPLRMMEMLRRS
jgi:glycosyltransferase involved in cell wall biosynthesis